MIRHDKRVPDRVREIISWVQMDSFWSANVLSPGKLRKNFDALEMKMKRTPSPLKKPSSENESAKKMEDLQAAARHRQAEAEAILCPVDIRPDFAKESEL
jgi:hypothetical protein